MNKLLFLFGLLLVLNCSVIPEQTTSQDIFHILSVSPQKLELLQENQDYEIYFSQPVSQQSVCEACIGLVLAEDYESEEDWKDIPDKLLNKEWVSLADHFLWDESGQVLKFKITTGLQAGEDYILFVLPYLQSQNLRPLNEKNTFENRPYIKKYSIPNLQNDFEGDSGFSNPSNEALESDENIAQYPIVPVVTPQVPDESEVIASFNWNRVLLTEISTDPQQDHNESDEGNGTLFDNQPGSGAVTTGDEYIELFNGSDEILDVSSWSIRMLDGTDEDMSLSDEDWTLFFSSGGSLESFFSGEFMVLGDPTGQMNNTIELELFDEEGTLIDQVQVEDANASDLTDESFFRLPDGQWDMGQSSLGRF